MKNFMLKISIFILFITISCEKDNASAIQINQLNSGSSQFVFTYSGLPQKPINVFYNIPSGNRTNMPIVMLFHGDERNANEYRDIWINASNQYGFMVFAPEFNSTDFPGGSSYIIGNVYQDGNYPTIQTLNNESVWTFSIVEPLFDYIKTNSGTTALTYNMFGHSGGGQFVHRFVLIKPDARYDKAVAANSGWYTVPDGVANFPYGILNCPIAAINPNNYFSRKLYITVGELDNNGSDPTLRHNSASDLQGLNRLERANYFFSKSQIYANTIQSTFNWQFNTVANSGHNATLMSNNAISIFFN